MILKYMFQNGILQKKKKKKAKTISIKKKGRKDLKKKLLVITSFEHILVLKLRIAWEKF